MLISAAKTGSAVGLVFGAYSTFFTPNGAFLIPALQSGGIATGVAYFMAGQGSMYNAAAIGAGMALSCTVLEGMGAMPCAQYGAIAAGLSWVALEYVSPELNDIYGDMGGYFGYA